MASPFLVSRFKFHGSWTKAPFLVSRLSRRSEPRPYSFLGSMFKSSTFKGVDKNIVNA